MAGRCPRRCAWRRPLPQHAQRHPGRRGGRGLRAAIIIGAAFLLVRAFGLDVDALAAGDTSGSAARRGACAGDRPGGRRGVDDLRGADRPEARRRSELPEEGNRAARLRTLLPIVRSTIAAALIVMVVLTALSALGIEVGPLLAGAGVVGVAIGFGAQTLVRDLFSKFFYLLDDAFRVGEYIESGNYKGTVEHLGARSVRLRHTAGRCSPSRTASSARSRTPAATG